MDKLLEALGRFLSSLVPPSPLQNGDRDLVEKTQLYDWRQRRWRWNVFYAFMILFTWNIIDPILSYGGVPKVFEGFERRADGQARKDQIARIELRLLEKDLLDTRVRQCKATDKGYFTERMQELSRQYETMTGHAWYRPQCDEVN